MLAEEPPPGSVITWFRQYPSDPKQYQYVAMRVEGAGWYLTGRTTKPQPWASIRKLIGGAECWTAQQWSPLPHAARFVALESEAEHRFWDAYIRLSPPEMPWLVPQYPVSRYRLDFAIPDRRIGIEIDGHAYHSAPDVFTRDRVRERALKDVGWDLIRFSGREACSNPEQCVRQAAALVARAPQWGVA